MSDTLDTLDTHIDTCLCTDCCTNLFDKEEDLSHITEIHIHNNDCVCHYCVQDIVDEIDRVIEETK